MFENYLGILSVVFGVREQRRETAYLAVCIELPKKIQRKDLLIKELKNGVYGFPLVFFLDKIGVKRLNGNNENMWFIFFSS